MFEEHEQIVLTADVCGDDGVELELGYDQLSADGYHGLSALLVIPP